MALSMVTRKSRRERILLAARRLFEERGVENTRMEEIASAAGFTRRTLYGHFRSRDEICMSVHLENTARRWAAQEEAMKAETKGIDKIRAWAETLYRFAKENPHALRLEIYWDFVGIDRERIGDEVFARFEELNEELARGLRRIFREGIEDGSLRPDLPVDATISQFLQSLRSVIHRAIAAPYSFARVEPDDYVHGYLDLFHRGIRHLGDRA